MYDLPNLSKRFIHKLETCRNLIENIFKRNGNYNSYIYHFGIIFELPTEGISYTLDKPIGFKNIKHYNSINNLVINPMEMKKVPFKSIHLKQKGRILHYLLTRIMFPRIINYGYVVREDVAPLWLLTQIISTNWVSGMFNHMI